MKLTPTRSVLLALRDERRMMGEGHHFLDEKRLLLAGEIMKQLTRYKAGERAWRRKQREAAAALEAAYARHGQSGLEKYPILPSEGMGVTVEKSDFFGVLLAEATFAAGSPDLREIDGMAASPEAALCREVFRDLVALAAERAALSGNLHRLLEDYRKTERRVRALENILLPEMDADIAEMDVRLEESEQEEVLRVRMGR